MDEIARRFNNTLKYVQKVLYRSDMKSYVRRLTNHLIYKVRQRFTAVIGLVQSAKYPNGHNSSNLIPRHQTVEFRLDYSIDIHLLVSR